jgi:hypothetical protein
LAESSNRLAARRKKRRPRDTKVRAAAHRGEALEIAMTEPTTTLADARRADCHPEPERRVAPSGRPLQGPELEFLLSGNRLHVRLPNGAIAQLSFDVAGTVHASFPDGTDDRGTWSIEADDRYCIRWVAGPALSCTRVSRSADGLILADGDGRYRGSIAAILPGR